jgi:divalent metal cation (Fe/Co/Zn/Cd) transporter
LTAFGLDSSIEVAASGVAAWQLRAEGTGRDRRALRAIGVFFLIVAAYVGVEATLKLIEEKRPLPSPAGIALTAAATLVMLGLGLAKNRVGKLLGNPVLVAEARFTLVDAALSATVLVGLTLNAKAGLWWADPLVAFLIALFAGKEGLKGIRR